MFHDFDEFNSYYTKNRESCDGFSFGYSDEILGDMAKDIKTAIGSLIDHAEEIELEPDDIVELWSCKKVAYSDITPSSYCMIDFIRELDEVMMFEQFLEDISKDYEKSLSEYVEKAIKQWIEDNKIYFNYFVGLSHCEIEVSQLNSIYESLS